MKTAFCGDTYKCFQHYATRNMPQGVKGESSAARKPLADFAKVTVRSVERWAISGRLPTGEPLLRLRIFLQECGYEVEELLVLPKEVVEFIETIVFDVVTLDKAVELLRVNRDHLLAVLRGAVGTSTSILEAMKLIHSRVADEVEERKKSFHHQHKIAHVVVVREGTIGSLSDADMKHTLVECFAGIIRELGPLVRLMSSNTFTVEDRKEMRRLIGENRFFELSTDINRLQSETARRQFTS